jgi:hypothetical protein
MNAHSDPAARLRAVNRRAVTMIALVILATAATILALALAGK